MYNLNVSLIQERNNRMNDSELRLECLRLVIDHHPEVITIKQRLELTEELFQYLDTGDIPE